MIFSIKGIVRKNRLLYLLSRPVYLKAIHFLAHYKWKALQGKSQVYLELGAGPNKGRGEWIGIDEQWGADICWDLRKGIPLEDGSVDKIYSSHMLEHIPFNDMMWLISECKRVLRKGGEFLVCVPNARCYIEAYMANETFVSNRKPWQPAVCDTGSAIDQLNYIAYMGGAHLYMFDEENLINVLRKVGFEEVRSREFDPNLDKKEHDLESIYAVAYK